MTAIGVDLSLRHTGIATDDGVTVLPEINDRGMARLSYIRNSVTSAITAKTKIVVIEGYSHGSGFGAHALGELGGVVRLAIFEMGVQHIDVAPNTVKKYATGVGNAGKERVVANARERLGYDGFDNNAADALWLRAIGMALLNVPVVDLPKKHTDALSALDGVLA